MLFRSMAYGVNAAETVYGSTFYDADDTNSYWAGDSQVMRGSSPTIYFRDTDGNSAMLHNNSNLFYILRGGNDTTTWAQVNSQWPAYWNLTNNDVVMGGGIYAIGNVTAYYSDERLKTKLSNIENSLDIIKSLNGFKYINNDLAKEKGYNDDKIQLGLSAQEIEKVLPELISLAPFDMETDPKTGKVSSRSGENYKTVDYTKLIPVLVEAIKEQQNQIEALKIEINSLKGVN